MEEIFDKNNPKDLYDWYYALTESTVWTKELIRDCLKAIKDYMLRKYGNEDFRFKFINGVYLAFEDGDMYWIGEEVRFLIHAEALEDQPDTPSQHGRWLDTLKKLYDKDPDNFWKKAIH